MEDYVYRDIRVSGNSSELILENSAIRRVFDLSAAVPRTISLVEREGNFEYAASDRGDGDFSFMGYNMPSSPHDTDYTLQNIEVKREAGDFLDGGPVTVRICIVDTIQGLFFTREYFIYPELPIIASRCGIRASVSPNIYWSRRGTSFNHAEPASFLESAVDSVKIKGSFQSFKAVEFFGRTDHTNELVREHLLSANNFGARGNILFAEDTERHGLFILQEAPPSSERRDMEAHDFRMENETLYSCGWGIAPHEVQQEKVLYGYRHLIGLFRDSENTGRKLLKDYLRTRFPQNAEKDFMVMVNPWGSGTFSKDMSEPFLLEEIKSAAELGATHYQIDDGWQQGRSLAQLNRNNRAIGKEFWQISKERLPHGFEKLHETATRHQIELGLWLAPSFNREFRDWELFGGLIWKFYKTYGIRKYKVDGIRMRTKESEDNLEKMIRDLRIRSDGDILFNFDTTEGQRPGYFLFLEYGNIFLENRYACHEWGQVYHPEQVLKNFWRLSQYVRPQTLQIEVTDYRNINRGYYESQGIAQPDIYSPDYWAAITLFANPLIWLSPSKLDEKVKTVYRRIISLHRKYRDQIFAHEIFPIGDEPSGGSLTGFQSHDFRSKSGFLVVYRELKGPESGPVKLLFLKDSRLKLSSLSDASADAEKPSGQDHVDLRLEQPGSFRLYQYTAY